MTGGGESDQDLEALEFLTQVTRETLSSVKLETILRRVARLLQHRFGYDYSAVALVEGDRVVFHAGSGGETGEPGEAGSGEYVWRIPVGRGIVGTAVAMGKPRLVNRVDEDPDYIRANFLAETRSELAVPLIHRDKVLGVLDVQSHQPDAFGDRDVRLLQIVGAMVSPAVHIASLYERERRRTQHLHLVSEISRLVMSSLERQTVINVACDAIMKALDVSFVGIALLDRKRGLVVHAGHATRVTMLPDVELTLDLGRGLVGRVAATGQALRIGEVSYYPGFLHVVPGMRSAVCVPLQVREGTMGVVEAEHSEPDYFTAEDEQLLTSLATYLAQAMENAQLFEDQRRRWQQLLLINEMTRVATETFDLDRVTSLVAKEIHDRFGFFAVAVLLCEDQQLVARALACDSPLDMGIGHSEPLGGGLAGRVARTGEVFQAGNRNGFDVIHAMREDIQSILCVPLRAPKQVIGVIQVQSPVEDAFDMDDRMVLETLAKSVAGAIDNARSIRNNEQFREDLNRMIVHDLRNPVHGVLLTLQAVEHAASEGEVDAEVLEDVTLGITRTEEIQAMISSLLDVSRFEAGKARLKLSPAAFNDHVLAVARRLTPLARSRHIELKLELASDLPVVWLDHDLIARTLDNLVGNAVKFTPEQGQIQVSTRQLSADSPDCPTPAPCVLVSVRDTGEGIPEEFHHKIFEKFGQVETRKAGLQMSTGLGLAHSRHVVEAHGGAIWVDSEPGHGACFHFTLPAGKPTA